ncbi:hypothetical protein Ahy_B09g096697 [Arachis hypogaea]|uniref:Zinc finger GRF-type domain-containing protein n=1 Tax=Arachis hypogaea TaxID=3818 RepID=A0A444XM29_ARAHY|nr:hypothetical protein Ahy_B09g096697 [Arachis hypogaea]
MSKTRSNLDRLFLGCPIYKARQPYCKFFLWLDEHVAGVGLTETRYMGEKEFVDVEDYHGKQDIEMRITCLEKRIIALEIKKNPIGWCICVIFIVLSFAVLSCKN